MLIFENELIKQGVDWEKLIRYFCKLGKILNEYYIYELFEGDNQILLYSIDGDLKNCPCGLIYNIEQTGDETIICVLFFATHPNFRSFGYASIFMREFIDNMKEKYGNLTIILDSIETAVSFYEDFGFKWTIDKKYDEKFGIDETNSHEHIIMIYKDFRVLECL